jgi:16S rRNA (guanine527-N7)-methyltransferase
VNGTIESAFAAAGLTGLPTTVYNQFHTYLELLLRWNRRLNLSAAREPEEIIERHFVECAFAAQHSPRDIESLLDYGSGAGFPGIPFAICRPEIQVALAEAHGRKASFLREALRVLGIAGEVYDGRVESMPDERQFGAVSVRAVEKMELAIPVATQRVARYLVLFTTVNSAAEYRELSPELKWLEDVPLPNSEQRILAIGQKL